MSTLFTFSVNVDNAWDLHPDLLAKLQGTDTSSRFLHPLGCVHNMLPQFKSVEIDSSRWGAALLRKGAELVKCSSVHRPHLEDGAVEVLRYKHTHNRLTHPELTPGQVTYQTLHEPAPLQLACQNYETESTKITLSRLAILLKSNKRKTLMKQR